MSDPRPEMTSDEETIFLVLKQNPDLMHVTEDGTKLYLLDPHAEGMICLTSSTNFNDMDAAALNEFIQEAATADWKPE